LSTDLQAAGGEFAQSNLPGTFGTDYQFISETAIDFFLGAGVNTIRLPFLLVNSPGDQTVHVSN
jgi:endoglucanase